MNTQYKSIVLVLICTLFTSVAQAFYKAGANKLVYTFQGLITNYQIIIGLVLYAIGSIILIKALKGADLSVLYPIIATSYIWVTILSGIVFNEIITFLKIVGVFFIILGVAAMGYGSRNGVESTS
tara:strand:- start:616 stop:990 length:375 start_codon:yes stop_codon:yes gene_type:complete